MKAETKVVGHTPGPWLNELKARDNYPQMFEDGCYDDGPLGGWVCEVRTPLGSLLALAVGADDEQTTANARLIAAAPDLLAAAEAALAAIEGYAAIGPSSVRRREWEYSQFVNALLLLESAIRRAKEGS